MKAGVYMGMVKAFGADMYLSIFPPRILFWPSACMHAALYCAGYYNSIRILSGLTPVSSWVRASGWPPPTKRVMPP